jgi:hypothetical protein
MLIAAPDGRVCKHKKQQLSDVTINDGVHMHGILVVPWHSRLKERVETHFKTHSKIYVQNNLLRLNIQPIQSNPENVVDYAMKALKTGTFGCDDIIIFPKADGEIAR